MVLGAPLLLVLVIPRLEKRAFRSARLNNPTAQSTQRFRLSSEGIRFSGNLFETFLRWEAITAARETEEFLFFYFAKDGAYFLPKRALDEEQLAGVRQMVNEAVGLEQRFRR